MCRVFTRRLHLLWLTVVLALVGASRGAIAQDTASIRGRWTAFSETVLTKDERGDSIPSWFGAADRREAFASLRQVGDILRRAPGIVEPVGFDVHGIREIDFRDEPFDTRPRRPVPGFVDVSPSDYRHREDGSLGTSRSPDTPSLRVVMNSFQCLLGTVPNGEREHVFTLEHRDGSFRGYPRYANGCVLITRPGAPAAFVPVSRGEWLRLLIAQLDKGKADWRAQGADWLAHRGDRLAKYRADSAREARDQRASLEEMRQAGIPAAQLEQLRTAWLDGQRMARRAVMEESATTLPYPEAMDAMRAALAAALAALSPAEQAEQAHFAREQSARTATDSARVSGLTTPDNPEGRALVRENPAFFDRSLPAGRPQLFTVWLHTVYSYKDGPASRAGRQAFEGLDVSALAALLR